jgi:large subunit ribosomal protein L19
MDVSSLVELKKNPKIPDMAPGDTVRVSARIVEGGKERIQVFQGVVIKIRRGGNGTSFTVRHVAYGVGVERTFPFHSPLVEKVEIVRQGKVRRSRLYYLRGLSGKAARRKIKRVERKVREQVGEELLAAPPEEGVEEVVAEAAEVASEAVAAEPAPAAEAPSEAVPEAETVPEAEAAVEVEASPEAEAAAEVEAAPVAEAPPEEEAVPEPETAPTPEAVQEEKPEPALEKTETAEAAIDAPAEEPALEKAGAEEAKAETAEATTEAAGDKDKEKPPA